MLKHILTRAGTHFSGSIVSKIFATTVYVLLSRYLAPAEYGQAILGVTVIMLGNVSGNFGFIQWYQKQEQEEEAFRTLVRLRLLFGVIVSIGIPILNMLLSWFPSNLALLIASVSFFHACIACATAYRIRHKQVIAPSLLEMMQAIPILMLIFFASDAITLVNVFAAYGVGSIFALILLFPWSRMRHMAHAPLSLLAALRSSSKYALLNYTSATYARADAIIVRMSLGEAALGFYGLAYRYLEYFALLPSSLVQILFPIFALSKGTSRRHLIQLTTIMAFLGTICGIVLFTGAQKIILLLHGQAYAPSIPVLHILSGTLILFFINAPLATFVQASQLVKKFLPFGIVNTLLNVGLNLVFIPPFGLAAAAYVMLLTEITGLVINIYFARKVFVHTL